MTQNIPVLYMIIPCYNEETVLPVMHNRFVGVLEDLISDGEVSEDSRVLYVNDGSTDNTESLLKLMHEHFRRVEYVSLGRNYGHQAALAAGIESAFKAGCDIMATLDCDGQDPPETLMEMMQRYKEGAEIVYGVRNDRSSDTLFKKVSAGMYYKTCNALGCDTIPGHADFRLFDRAVAEEFILYKEHALFLRGIFRQIGKGRKTAKVFYKRDVRAGGSTHYSLPKMLCLADAGIFGFTDGPLGIILTVGATCLLAGVVLLIVACARRWELAGCAAGCFGIFSGLSMLSTWLVGRYVYLILQEVKDRPRFTVKENSLTMPHNAKED